MQILITGGAGFIGSNLCRYVLSKGDSVRVLDDFSTGRRENIENLDVDLLEGSLLSRPTVQEAVQGVDAIVHLGAIPSVPRSIEDPFASHYANATGTLNLLDAAVRAGISHVSVASSSSVYGANPNLPKSEDDYTRPMSPYAVTKLATEGYAFAYQYSYHLPTVAFRLFNVYGPGQPADHDYAAVVPKFIDAGLKGRRIAVHGDGTQSRDFTYVETVCAVLHLAARRSVLSQQPVNLAFQTKTTLLELLSMLEQKLEKRLVKSFEPPRRGDVWASQADCRRVVEIFPEIRPIELSDGLDRTIAWMGGRG